MKSSLIVAFLCLSLTSVKADPICGLIPESTEYLEPGYGDKFSYEPWNQCLHNQEFAAWNKNFDKDLQEKVLIISVARISTDKPLQNKFNISMSRLSRQIHKVHLLESSSNAQFDDLCKKAIESLDGSEQLETPEVNQSYLLKPISFEMPANSASSGTKVELTVPEVKKLIDLPVSKLKQALSH